MELYRESLLPLWPQVAQHVNDWLSVNAPHEQRRVSDNQCIMFEETQKQCMLRLAEQPWTPDEVVQYVDAISLFMC